MYLAFDAPLSLCGPETRDRAMSLELAAQPMSQFTVRCEVRGEWGCLLTDYHCLNETVRRDVYDAGKVPPVSIKTIWRYSPYPETSRKNQSGQTLLQEELLVNLPNVT